MLIFEKKVVGIHKSHLHDCKVSEEVEVILLDVTKFQLLQLPGDARQREGCTLLLITKYNRLSTPLRILALSFSLVTTRSFLSTLLFVLLYILRHHYVALKTKLYD